ncbi:MAG: zinc-ribbon domain-containing protein, partial [Desulfuromonadales bacterium]|nr:zinc-ribbon domain-containing protein [Desulfuromonadales bacterium]
MIVQCEACQTRFRLADEKIKPGGTKVRCSKCKQIFKVTPPAPEPEPTPVSAPVQESVDFDASNMERVADTPSSDETQGLPDEQTSLPPLPEDVGPESTPEHAFNETFEPAQTPGETSGGDLDFSSLEQEMTSDGPGEEPAEDFSFADTSQPTDAPEESADDGSEQESAEQEMALDFSEGPSEFDFGEADSAATEAIETDAEGDAESAFETNEFSFGEDEASPAEQIATEEPAFDSNEDASAFDFDDDQGAAPSVESGSSTDDANTTGPSEFSFDDEEETTDWSEGGGDDAGDSFDFEEPQFETSS